MAPNLMITPSWPCGHTRPLCTLTHTGVHTYVPGRVWTLYPSPAPEEVRRRGPRSRRRCAGPGTRPTEALAPPSPMPPESQASDTWVGPRAPGSPASCPFYRVLTSAGLAPAGSRRVLGPGPVTSTSGDAKRFLVTEAATNRYSVFCFVWFPLLSKRKTQGNTIVCKASWRLRNEWGFLEKPQV